MTGRVRGLAAAVLAGLALLTAPRSWAQSEGPAPFSDPMSVPVYNPLQGMEPSGRIPRVAMPLDLPEPSRWRYIPEGRLKPGAFYERLMVTSFLTPQVFYLSDVGTGGGIALTDIDFRNQRRQEFLGAFLTYTTEGQQRYRLIWRHWLHHRDLPAGGVALEERSFLDAAVGYEKTLTRRFFGLGPDTRARDETSYTDEVTDVGLRADLALPRPGGDVVASFGVRGEHHNLAPGRVSGHPTTNQVFPVLFAEGDGHDSLGVTAGLRYDTRDSQHQPFSGWRVGLVADASLWQNTGAPGAVVSGYANVAFPLPPLLHGGGDDLEEHPPTDSLALGVHVATTVGDLPYFALPSLGGSSTLRGYIANRFTGDSAWHAVAEYRFWVVPRGFALTDTIRVERVGLAVFGEAGTVADSLGSLPGARVHTSYGVGLRVSLDRTALFRADLGFSPEGTNFTVTFGLGF